MTKVQYEPNWITDDFFFNANPVVCNILQAKVEEKNGKQEIIIVIGAGKNESKMSIWGNNKRNLAIAFGDGRSFDTDDLIGKQIRLSQTTDANDGKRKRIVEAYK